MSIIILLPFFLLFYFLLIRPQQKKVREHQALVAGLEEGDDVLLTSGIYGAITAIDREVIEVEVAEGIELRVARTAVSDVVEYDTDELDAEASDADEA
jgi:preprotein translocase subunit YajC